MSELKDNWNKKTDEYLNKLKTKEEKLAFLDGLRIGLERGKEIFTEGNV